MSPKDISGNSSEPQTQNKQQVSTSSSASTHSIDQIVDNIAFGAQTDNRSAAADSQSIRSQINSQLRSRMNKNTIFGYEMPFDVISAAFAATVAAGGIMGYVKAKSTYSLIAGLVFGGILGFGAYQTSVDTRNYYLTLGTSAVLGSFMGYRAINSGKFMPAGLVATLSGLMVLRFAIRFLTETNRYRK